MKIFTGNFCLKILITFKSVQAIKGNVVEFVYFNIMLYSPFFCVAYSAIKRYNFCFVSSKMFIVDVLEKITVISTSQD